MVGVLTLDRGRWARWFPNRSAKQGIQSAIQRGLNTEEARFHMAKVAQQNKVGLFATAEDHAGLEVGVDVVSAEERKAAQAQAEMDAIYGTAATVDPNAGFAPAAYNPPALSQASSQAAAEAAALLSDDDDAMTGGDPLESIVEDIAGAAAVAACPLRPSGTGGRARSAWRCHPRWNTRGRLQQIRPLRFPRRRQTSPNRHRLPPVPPASTAVRHTCTSAVPCSKHAAGYPKPSLPAPVAVWTRPWR